ncbi:MAG: ribosome small subunit-dependent GTPase A [Gammaproteobacteria bacterium]|nr:ribosome small subunit-dependent GTPase A [Gammaproteobacteria bacterium]
MELNALGFDEWYREKLTQAKSPEWTPARVTAVDRDSYLIRNGDSDVRSELAGNFLFTAQSGMDMPCVGDWVFAQFYDKGTFAVIYDLFPRKSLLRRKMSGKTIDYQVIAANIDVAFILQSCDANFNIHRLERYLVMVNDGKIQSWLVLTKCDLVDPQELQRLMAVVREARIDCPIIPISNRTGFGLEELRGRLESGKTYCLLGSSGVGKTTTINQLIGQAVFDTQTVRDFDGKGRHTTTRRQLIVLEQGALLIDTPGMRELGTIGMSSGIDQSFIDIAEISMGCRFSDCTHTTEDGCALLAAVRDEILSKDRYDSYMKLMGESDYHEMSYVEKRRKDKEFGKFIKTVSKQIKK